MLMQPHRKHLYQLLANEMGIEHWKVAAGAGKDRGQRFWTFGQGQSSEFT